MRPVLFLRTASVLTFIHAVLHTVGGVFGKPNPGVQTMVVAAMRTRFPFLGTTRSYSDFYLGMGLAVSIFLTIEAIAFWILGSMSKSDAARLRPLLGIFVVGYLAMAVNSYAFFFVAPVIVEGLIAACLVMAIYTASSKDSAAA